MFLKKHWYFFLSSDFPLPFRLFLPLLTLTLILSLPHLLSLQSHVFLRIRALNARADTIFILHAARDVSPKAGLSLTS